MGPNHQPRASGWGHLPILSPAIVGLSGGHPLTEPSHNVKVLAKLQLPLLPLKRAQSGKGGVRDRDGGVGVVVSGV